MEDTEADFVEAEAGADDAINVDRLVTRDRRFDGLILLEEDTGVSFKLFDMGTTCVVVSLAFDKELCEANDTADTSDELDGKDELRVDIDTLDKAGTGALVTWGEGTLSSALTGVMEREFSGGAGLDFLATIRGELVVIFLAVTGTLSLFNAGGIVCASSIPSILWGVAAF